jgi:hypothetical protein
MDKYKSQHNQPNPLLAAYQTPQPLQLKSPPPSVNLNYTTMSLACHVLTKSEDLKSAQKDAFGDIYIIYFRPIQNHPNNSPGSFNINFKQPTLMDNPLDNPMDLGQ